MGELDLSKYGGKRIRKGGVPNNLLVDLRAATKCGTTRLALKAPKKNGMCYVNFDRPLIEVQNLAKLIGDANLQEVPCQEWSRNPNDQGRAKEIAERVQRAAHEAVRQEASTVVIDKATDLNSCVKFALYGKEDRIVKREYGVLNTWWKNLLQPFKASYTNLILIHKLAEVYKDDSPTGITKSKGWGEISYECTVSVEMGKDPKAEGLDKFWLFISDCTFSTKVEGMEMRGKEISFANLAQLILPTSDPSDWE